MIYTIHNTAIKKPPSQTEQAVRSWVERCGREYYDDILKETKDGNAALQLSRIRTGLISWYPFSSDADALEIGAGFGALTGILCDRCAQVTACERSVHRAETVALRWKEKENLRIYAGEWSDIDFGRKFDYILMAGILEAACGGAKDLGAYEEYVKKAARLLKPGGTLLISVRNRFGMKYFCGEAEPYTKKLMEGINDYPNGAKGRLFSREELVRIMKAAGFQDYCFFYPVPDEKRPQRIYADDCLPEGDEAGRLEFDCRDASDRIVVEEDFFHDLTENGAFPFLANSFFVECCLGECQREAVKFLPYAVSEKKAASADAQRLNEERRKIYENAARLQAVFPGRKQDAAGNGGFGEGSLHVSSRIKKIWEKELEILSQVQKICERHGLQYFMVHGTLLGAVRHRGFIPWDDDLDIGMLRKDFDRFLKAAEEELEAPFFLQTMRTDTDCFFGNGARVRNSETTGIQVRELGHRSNQGIWIDIQCFDSVTAEEYRLRKKVKKIKHYHRLLHAKIYGKQERRFAELNPWRWRWYRLLVWFCSHEKLCDGLDRALRLYADEGSEDIAVFGYGMPQRLHRKDFAAVLPMEFEGRMLPAPQGYEDYLFCIMGKDYMRLPPSEERKPKHTGIFDPERPYEEYMRKLTGMFENLKGKQIILFGAGLMFEDYMKKWGGRYRPAFLVDNDENKWGKRRMGIEIKNPEELRGIPRQKRRLIICSYYYKEIETQLEAMGIHDYRVYIQHLEWILEAEKS